MTLTTNSITEPLLTVAENLNEKKVHGSKNAIKNDKDNKKNNERGKDEKNKKNDSIFASFLSAQITEIKNQKYTPKEIDKNKIQDEKNVHDAHSRLKDENEKNEAYLKINENKMAQRNADAMKNHFIKTNPKQKDAQQSKSLIRNDFLKKEVIISNTKNQTLDINNEKQANLTNPIYQKVAPSHSLLNQLNHFVSGKKTIDNTIKTHKPNVTLENTIIENANKGEIKKNSNALQKTVIQNSNYKVTSQLTRHSDESQGVTYKNIDFLEKQKHFVEHHAERNKGDDTTDNNSSFFENIASNAQLISPKEKSTLVSVHHIPAMILHQLANGKQQIVLHLNPKNFGSVRIQIHTGSKIPKITICADQKAGYNEIQSQLKTLMRDIQQQFPLFSMDLVLTESENVSNQVVTEIKNDRDVQKQNGTKIPKFLSKRKKE